MVWFGLEIIQNNYMITKTISLYDYSELSEKAYLKAYHAWYEHETDPMMQSHMINVLKDMLDEIGLEYDEDSIDVRYSLSYCQGDGLMFVGRLTYKGEEIEITHRNPHYCHMYTAEIETGDLNSEDVDAFKALYQKVCKEMEQIGYDHIEHVTSQDSFKEACEANEWTFREDGTMENA